MERQYLANAAVSPPSSPGSPSSGYPTDGNPSTGTAATYPGAYWFHMVMEEIRAVIVAGGLTPSASTLTQLRDGLLAYVASSMATLATNAGWAHSFGTSGYVKFPSWFGGFIIQWGLTATMIKAALPGTTTSFTIAFPNHCYGVIGNAVSSGGNYGIVGIGTVTTSSFQSSLSVNGATTDNSGAYYIAVGY